MNKILIISLLLFGLLMVSSVSAYYCIYQEDNDAVKQFKSDVNMMGVQQDLDNGYSVDAIKLKIKYFNGCK